MTTRITTRTGSSILLSTIVVAALSQGVEGFSLSLPSSLASSPASHLSAPNAASFPSQLDASRSSFNDEYDDDNGDREFARIRRRRSQYDEDDDRYDYESESVMDAADILEDEGFFDNLDDDDDDDDDFEEDSEVLSNTLIPNPILDSIDPDGAAERFPELAADPRFWFDMFLFIGFLNFISFIGPRNPFPEMIPSMYTAGLPPPGM